MKTVKQIFAHFSTYVIWLLLSVFVWSWIFNMINDTSTFHKVSMYIDCHECADLDLTLELEEDMPKGIKMVKVHPLSYVVFDESTMFMGDILILRESQMENYRPVLADITALSGRWTDRPRYSQEDADYGIQVYDGQTGEGILSDYVTFLHPGEEQENFYLVFLAESRHLGSLNGSKDDAAFQMADRLLTME